MGGDPLFVALFFAKGWWSQLGAAEAWAKAARLLEPIDPGAGRAAWGRAARSYGIYNDEHRAHLPASRFDYDYGPELTEAATKARELPDRQPSEALPEWARLVLAGRFGDALPLVAVPPEAPAERALLAVLVLALHHADREDEAQRLVPWCQ